MNPNVKSMRTSKFVQELDKFKRRLIRAVARRLLQEKKPEHEVWADLRKETGCDCMLLWSRMRALTLKKLSHLLAADDYTETIPKAAQMSITDWLMFDLVLVHQKIDLLGQDDLKRDPKVDPKPLVDLFELVKIFKIEGLSGGDLAEAWSTATLYYNNLGHKCSPMLLQRRWYQLKELTRTKFYDYWYMYRGTAKRISLAEPHMPTPLQVAIARQFKHLVTSPFMEWEEMIKMRLVTMPEEFERKMMERSAKILKTRPVKMSETADDGPDLEVIEPNIETIDLGLESDEENENVATESTPVAVRIKQEPLDMDIDIDETQIEPPKKSIYEKVLESTAIENEKLDSMDAIDQEFAAQEIEIAQAAESLRTQEEVMLPQITSVVGNVSDTSAICNIDNTNEVGSVDNNSVIDNADLNSGVRNERDDIQDSVQSLECNENLTLTKDTTDTNVVAAVEGVEIEENFSSPVIMNFSSEIEENFSNPVITSVSSEAVVVEKLPVIEEIHEVEKTTEPENIHEVEEIHDVEKTTEPDDDIEETHEIENAKEPENKQEMEKIHDVEEIYDVVRIREFGENPQIEEIQKIDDTKVSENYSPAKENEVDLKPEIKEYSFIDPFKVSNMEKNEDFVKAEGVSKKLDVEIKADVKFSFGELSSDINFADDGIEFIDDGIAYYDEDDQDNETKIKIEVEEEEKAEDTPKIDEKLLMCPIIYTTKLDDMWLFKTASFDHIKGSQILDIITSKSKPIKRLPVDITPKDDDNDEDDIESEENIITDKQRVKPTSYLLQKPRSRTYNPIQLCKNPDFNTRLKRLTVGFFSSPRNRGLIKSCKPLTIDVSKAFESKLISGTIYLKPSDQNVKPEKVDDIESSQSVSVLPSAMPAQSLIDNSKIPDILPVFRSNFVSPETSDNLGSTSERNKVINLPDISEIRRNNQRLLIAEITPMQVRNTTTQVPVSIVPSLNANTFPVQQTSTVTENGKDILTKANDSRGPPKIVDITQDSSVNKTFGNSSALKTYCSKSVNRLPQQESSSLRYTGRPPKMVNGKRLWPPKPVSVLWKPRQMRPEIPWLPKSDTPYHREDTLLTLDALNKMLHLLIYDKEDATEPLIPKPKSKKYKKNAQRQAKGNTAEDNQAPLDDFSDVQIISENNPPKNPSPPPQKDTEETEVKKCCKPKINIRHATNYECNQRKDLSNVADSNKVEVNVLFKDPKQINAVPLEDTEQSKCCCWARQRMLQMLFPRKSISTHECPSPLCTCCCRKLLQQYVINDNKIKKAECKSNVINLDDDDEHVAEISVQATCLNTSEFPIIEVPALNIEPHKDNSTINVNESEPVVINAMNNQGNVPQLGSEVSVTTSTSSPNNTLMIEQTVNESPKNATAVPTSITINVPALQEQTGYFKSSVKPKYVTKSSQLLKSKSKKHNNYYYNRFEQDKSSSLTKLLALKKNKNQTKFKTLVHSSSLNVKTDAQTKNVKEKMIYLNSKLISEKPADNPIFLGKNKILMTTVKFPPYLRDIEDAKRSLGLVKVPHGVQLICLPNGTVSYIIDPKVPVDALELSNLPAIVAAIQAQINPIPTHPEILPQVGVTQNEVVDLIDDDDTPPNVDDKTDQNTKPPPSVEVKTSEVELSKICEDSSQIPQIVTGENCAESNNENNKIISTEIQTGIQDVIAHQTATDIAETVQEPSHNEKPSTSTEQVQPEASQTENIEEKEKTTSEPSSGSKTKNNILSDLMEMWGIFDEDITPMPEETLPEKPAEPVVMTQGTIETPLLLSSESVVEQPAAAAAVVAVEQPTIISSAEPQLLAPVQPSTQSKSPILVPELVLGNARHDPGCFPPVLKSPIGELTPITSLYELKYACLNNGSFFKLDFETGLLVPINVCLKQQPKASLEIPFKISETKLVIDLTDDDDSLDKSINPSKRRSFLVADNSSESPSKTSDQPAPSTSSTDSYQVKPVKLFRAVKPGILQRLSQNKDLIIEEKTCNLMSKNPMDVHRHKRKQSLKDVNVDVSISVLKKYPKKNTRTDVVDHTDIMCKGTAPIDSDDSDDEPLSKVAKRIRESGVATAVQKDVEVEIQDEDSTAVQNEVEDLPASDPADVYMSDQEPIDPTEHYEIIMDTVNDEEVEEDNCILGV